MSVTAKTTINIFFSHSKRDKPLVREIRRNLDSSPSIKCWIDERELIIGRNLDKSIRSAIVDESDFLVIFLAPEFSASKWLKKELRWALEREREIGRPFVLPIVLDKNIWDTIEPQEFRQRLYLSCYDFAEDAVRLLANRIKEYILGHFCILKKKEYLCDIETQLDKDVARLKQLIEEHDKRGQSLRRLYEGLVQELETASPGFKGCLIDLDTEISLNEKEIESFRDELEYKMRLLETIRTSRKQDDETAQ